MTPLTVCCVFVKGNVPYTNEYVTNLRGMVAKWLKRPHRFVCLTDQPRLLKGVETITIKSPKPLAGWWSKIQLFDRAHGLTGRVLYLDLDSLVVAPLDPIVDYPAPFALVPHAGNFEGRDGLVVVKRFNSSVMVWDAGVNARLFDDWTPDVAKRLHGDQDFIGEQMPEAATMPLCWFPRLSSIQGELVPPEALVVLAKTPKPAEASRRWPWVALAWRAA